MSRQNQGSSQEATTRRRWLVLGLSLSCLCLLLAPATRLAAVASRTTDETAEHLTDGSRLTAPGLGNSAIASADSGNHHGGFGKLPGTPESERTFLSAAVQLGLPATGPTIASTAAITGQRVVGLATPPPAQAADVWFATREFLGVATTALRDRL